MKKRDRLGLVALALITLVILLGIWVTARSSNLKSDVTGGTPFAKDPAARKPVGDPVD
jgi:hypothetical protein